MKKQNNKDTAGQRIYSAISPFMFSQHSLSRSEAEKMVANTIDKEVDYWKNLVREIAEVGIIGEKSYHRANVAISHAIVAIAKHDEEQN